VHRAIYRAARNPRLEDVLIRYDSLATRIFCMFLDRLRAVDTHVDENGPLLRAIAVGEAAKAARLARDQSPDSRQRSERSSKRPNDVPRARRRVHRARVWVLGPSFRVATQVPVLARHGAPVSEPARSMRPRQGRALRPPAGGNRSPYTIPGWGADRHVPRRTTGVVGFRSVEFAAHRSDGRKRLRGAAIGRYSVPRSYPWVTRAIRLIY
jgi:hypothetical protein